MRRFTRRTVLGTTLGTALSGAALLPALAVRRAGADAAVQFNRPIRVVSPYAAGGVGENIMHLLAVSMEPQLGQKLILEARPGPRAISAPRKSRTPRRTAKQCSSAPPTTSSSISS